MRWLVLLVFLATSHAYADEALEQALREANLSIPYYGTQFYGRPKAQVFKVSEHVSWLVHQARYGGDGEHTENILMIFEVSSHGVNKIFQYSLSNVTFKSVDGYLIKISGEVIETLCDVCDGWEVSSPEDIFRVPVEITTPSMVIRTTLTASEAKNLLSKLDRQSDANIKEQLSYGNSKYPIYAKDVVKRINALLVSYNN